MKLKILNQNYGHNLRTVAFILAFAVFFIWIMEISKFSLSYTINLPFYKLLINYSIYYEFPYVFLVLFLISIEVLKERPFEYLEIVMPSLSTLFLIFLLLKLSLNPGFFNFWILNISGIAIFSIQILFLINTKKGMDKLTNNI